MVVGTQSNGSFRFSQSYVREARLSFERLESRNTQKGIDQDPLAIAWGNNVSACDN